MNPSDSGRRDERLAALLAAYDDALISGDPPTPVDRLAELVDQEARAGLKTGIAVLDMLERVWPRSPRGGQSKRGDAPNAAPAPDPFFHLPGRIGRFVIERELGRGGCGIVLLALDPQLGREVALKVPRPEIFAIPEIRERFLREARAAAELDHPNVVTVYEAGEADGICYIAAAYCDGLTLSAWLRQQQVPVREAMAVELVAAIADGVQHAHEHGILHRDIKPSNVLLSPKSSARHTPERDSTAIDELDDSRSGLNFVPRLTDFGLARILSERTETPSATRVGQSLTLTPSGAVLGTPSYMAPEQAGARFGKIGAHTDVYALGVLLYETLTGALPFRGATELEVYKQLESSIPLAPSRLRPGLSRQLDAICLQCLEKEPASRYQSAAALARDLRRFRRGERILARRVLAPRRAWRWALRRPSLAALWTVSALALLSLVVLGSWYTGQLRQTAAMSALVERDAADKRQAALLEQRSQKHHESVKGIQEAYRFWTRAQVPQMLDVLARSRPRAGAEESRSFAWGFLSQLRHSEQLSFREHHAPVRAVAISPRGKLVASAGQDRVIRLWDPVTGNQIKTLPGHTCDVTGLAFCADGSMLASASDDSTVRLWHVSSGTTHALLKHPAAVSCLAISRDDRFVATGSADRQVRIWNLASGKESAVFQGDHTEINSVAFSSDGRTLACAGQAGTVIIWDISKPNARESLQVDQSPMRAVAFSHNGKKLVSTALGNHLAVWNTDPPRSHTLWSGHRDCINALAFSPDDQTLASAADDCNVYLWNTATGKTRTILKGHTQRVTSVAYSPDGKTVASASLDGTARIWDAQGVQEHRPLRLEPGALEYAISPDGSSIIGAQLDGGPITLWETATGKATANWDVEISNALPPTVVHCGHTVACGCANDKVQLWNLKTHHQRKLRIGGNGKMRYFSLSPDGTRLAAGEEDGRITVWDVAAEQPVARLEGALDLRVLAFSPDGTKLAAGSAGKLQVWGWASQKILTEWERPRDWMLCIAFSPDGQMLAVGYDSGTIELRQALTGKLEHAIESTEAVYRLAFSPDAKILATGGKHTSVKLWDPLTSQELIPLVTSASGPPISVLGFTPDCGKLLAGPMRPAGNGWEFYVWCAGPSDEAGTEVK